MNESPIKFENNVLLLEAVVPVLSGVVVALYCLCVTVLWLQVLMMSIWRVPVLQGDIRFSVWVSFAQIYNEQIFDLPQPTPNQLSPTIKLCCSSRIDMKILYQRFVRTVTLKRRRGIIFTRFIATLFCVACCFIFTSR